MAFLTTFLLSTMKFLSRHKYILCYGILVWGIATFISTLIGNWSWSKEEIQSYPHAHQTALKHHPMQAVVSSKFNRAIKYCNLPRNMVKGQEGAFRQNDNLEAVVVITRHGDRGSLHEFRNHSSIDCGLSSAEYPELSALIQHLHETEQRGEARGAFAQFPLLPPLGRSCTPGQLSAQGLLQMIQLGQHLRSAYDPDVTIIDQVIAHSTSISRTYHSLLALLYGLFPAFNMSSLSVKPGLGLTFCYTPSLCDCPALESLEQLVRKERWKHLSSHPAVQELVRSLNPFLKIKETDNEFTWPDDILDMLMVHMCHGGVLPCNNEVCATVDQVNNVIGFLEWSGKQVASYGPFKRSSKLRIHGFLVDLVLKLTAAKRGKMKHKMFIYSAHDVTLVPLMSVFGFFDGSKVPYASRVILELYSSTQPASQQIYHLRILYNGKDVTKKVHFCHSSSNSTTDKHMCPLNNILHYVNKDYFKGVNATNFKSACAMIP